MHQTELHPGQQPGLVPCFWGSVNQWECDENDHQNVRYYAHKINQALQIFVAGLGGGQPAQTPARIRAQHIRFLRESRSAAPLRVDCGLIGHNGDAVDVLSVMHHNLEGEPLAAFVTTLDCSGWAVDWSGVQRVAMPEYAGPRGVDPATLPPPPATLEAARRTGFRVVGRGVIAPEECDPAGRLLPHVYIGRISDGMPNLWAFVGAEQEAADRESGKLGGAALEQRLVVHAPLEAGSVFSQLSGVRALGNKTQQMAHLIYDESTGRIAATAEAVGVAMDLATRKAIPISKERRTRLETLLVTPTP